MSSTLGHVWTTPGMSPHCDTSPACGLCKRSSGGEVGGAPDISSLILTYFHWTPRPQNSQVLKKCLNRFLLLSTPALNFTRNSHCNKWPIMNVNMWIYDVGCSLPVWSVCAVRAAVGFFFFWGQTKNLVVRFPPSDKTLGSSLHIQPSLCGSMLKRGQSCSGGTRARTHSRKILIGGEHQSYFKHHSSGVSSQQVSCATRTVRSAEQCWGRLRRRHWHLGRAAIAVISE